MNIFQWLKKQDYEYTWNTKIGTKTPDLIAFKEKEIIVFEVKRHATEISNAIGQCLFYLQNANKAYIILPLKEIKKIQPSSLELLKKYGIGLIQANKNIKILIESNFFPFYNEEIIKKLKSKSLSKINLNFSRTQKSFKNEIKALLQKHPEGLTAQDLSQLIGAHRHTVTKYILALEGSGLVYRRRVGSATLHYLKETFQRNSVIK